MYIGKQLKHGIIKMEGEQQILKGRRSMKTQARMYVSAVAMMVGVLCAVNGYAGLDIQEYGFGSITNNNYIDAQIGQQQLSVWITDQGTIDDNGEILHLVGFKFMNAGPDECVITEIYFQGGPLFEFVGIDEDLIGVDFDEGEVGDVSPGNLPGGKSITPQFIADAVFSMQPNNPAPKWGVGPGETVEVIYSLEPISTCMDIVNQLDLGDMRIGIHVQSFVSGGSESFINVPEPATLIILGLGGLALQSRRVIKHRK